MLRSNELQSSETFLPFFNEKTVRVNLRDQKKHLIQLIVFIAFSLLLMLTALVIFFTVPGVLTPPSIVIGLSGLIIFSSTLALCIQSYRGFRKSSEKIKLLDLVLAYRAPFVDLSEKLKKSSLIMREFQKKFHVLESVWINESHQTLIKLSDSSDTLYASIASLTPDTPIDSDFSNEIGRKLKKLHQTTDTFLVGLQNSIDQQSMVLLDINNLRIGIQNFESHVDAECLISGILKDDVSGISECLLNLGLKLSEVENQILHESEISSETMSMYHGMIKQHDENLMNVMSNFQNGVSSLRDLIDSNLLIGKLNDVRQFVKHCDSERKILLNTIAPCIASKKQLLSLKDNREGLQTAQNKIKRLLNQFFVQIQKIPCKGPIMRPLLSEYSNFKRITEDWQSASEESYELKVNTTPLITEESNYKQCLKWFDQLAEEMYNRSNFADILKEITWTFDTKLKNERSRIEELSFDSVVFFADYSSLFLKGDLNLNLTEIEKTLLQEETSALGLNIAERYGFPTTFEDLDVLGRYLYASLVREWKNFESWDRMLGSARVLEKYFNRCIRKNKDLSDRDLAHVLDQQLIALVDSYRERYKILQSKMLEFYNANEKVQSELQKLRSYNSKLSALSDKFLEAIPTLKDLVEKATVAKQSSDFELETNLYLELKQYLNSIDATLSFSDDEISGITIEELSSLENCLSIAQYIQKLAPCLVKTQHILLMIEDMDSFLMKSIVERLNGVEQEIDQLNNFITREGTWTNRITWLERVISCLEVLGCPENKYSDLLEKLLEQSDKFEELKLLYNRTLDDRLS